MKRIIALICISLIFNTLVPSVVWATGYPIATVESTPGKPKVPEYDGISINAPITSPIVGNVPVKPCISLGKEPCVNQILKVITPADQFVVAFMYRFDSSSLIQSLAEKYRADKNVLVFLDYNQASKLKTAEKLIKEVPISLVKLGNDPFHQKVIIAKKTGEQAFVIIGSANATFYADSYHSEDTIIIQSNKLARKTLEEFEKLLTPTNNKPEKLIFHEHRLDPEGSNRKQIDVFKKMLDGKDNEAYNKEFDKNSYRANIVALGISSMTEDGQLKCFNTLLKGLKKEQEAPIIFFENYMNADEIKKTSRDFWDIIENDQPKLFVLDEDKNDSKFMEEIRKARKKDLTALSFKPYTGGTFHHKLVIQYFPKSSPVVYTGSFHLSGKAITSNSETIIGIASKRLAEDYLSLILDQSGLGHKNEVWEFFNKNTGYFASQSNPKLKSVAEKIKNINEKSYHQYFYRLKNSIKILSVDKFIKKEDFGDNLGNFSKTEDLNRKLTTLEEITKKIFNEPVLNKITKKVNDILEEEGISQFKAKLLGFESNLDNLINEREIQEERKKIVNTILDLIINIKGHIKSSRARKSKNNYQHEKMENIYGYTLTPLKRDKIENPNITERSLKKIEDIYNSLNELLNYRDELLELNSLNETLDTYIKGDEEFLDIEDTESVELESVEPTTSQTLKSTSPKRSRKRTVSEEPYSLDNLKAFLDYLTKGSEKGGKGLNINRIYGNLGNYRGSYASVKPIKDFMNGKTIPQRSKASALWKELIDAYSDEFTEWQKSGSTHTKTNNEDSSDEDEDSSDEDKKNKKRKREKTSSSS